MKKLYLATLVIMAAALIAMPSVAQANLLSNPGFEIQGTGDAQDAANWTESGEASRQSWANHTDFQGMALTAWGAGTGEAYQAVSATEGFQYTLDAWTLSDSATYTGDFYMELAWYNGATLLSTDSQSIALTNAGWAEKTLVATAPSSTDTVRAILRSSAVTTTGKFDDADVTAVPEPSSLMLLGSGLMGLFGFGIRKKNK